MYCYFPASHRSWRPSERHEAGPSRKWLVSMTRECPNLRTSSCVVRKGDGSCTIDAACRRDVGEPYSDSTGAPWRQDGTRACIRSCYSIEEPTSEEGPTGDCHICNRDR